MSERELFAEIIQINTVQQIILKKYMYVHEKKYIIIISFQGLQTCLGKSAKCERHEIYPHYNRSVMKMNLSTCW